MSGRRHSAAPVGRAPDIAELAGLWGRVCIGSSHVVLLGGEAGIGKTRLVTEFVTTIRGPGVTVIKGGCHPFAAGTIPFDPVIEAFESYAQTLDGAAVEELVSVVGPELAALVPRLPGFGGEASETGHGRLYAVISHVLRRLALAGPVLFVLEDLQWSDPSTADLVMYLARTISVSRVLVIGTYRTGDLPGQHPFQGVLAEARRCENVTISHLEPLTPEETMRLFREVAPAAPTSVTAVSLHERTGGNPFYIEELATATNNDGRIPERVRGALIASLGRLDHRAVEVLQVAAILGGRASFEDLMVISALEVSDVADALRELTDRGVLVVDNEGESYGFRHALLREAVEADVLPGYRERLHARCADMLAARPDPDVASKVRLAHHWYAAHDLARALNTSLAAGDATKRLGALAEASALYLQALDLWDGVAGTSRPSDTEHLKAIEMTVHLLRCTGQSRRAEVLSQQGHDIALSIGDRPSAGVFLSLLGLARFDSGALDILETNAHAVDLVRDGTPDQQADVLRRHSFGLWLHGMRRESLDSSRRAMALLPEVRDATVKSVGMEHHACMLVLDGQYLEALDLSALAFAEAQEHGGESLLIVQMNVAETFRHLGRYDDAIELHIDGVSLAYGMGFDRGIAASFAGAVVEVLFCRGQWDTARLIAATAIQRAGLDALSNFPNTALVLVHAGHDELVDELLRAAAPDDLMMFARLEHAFVAGARAILTGHPDEALDEINRARTFVPNQHFPWSGVNVLWIGVWAAADLHHLVSESTTTASEPYLIAESIISDLRRMRDDPDPDDSSPAIDFAGYVLIAEAEFTRFDDSSNPESWGKAIEEWDRIGFPYHAAYCRFRAAEALLAHRNVDRAMPLLQEAAEVATTLGAQPLQRMLNALTTRHRINLGPTVATSEPIGPRGPQLTRRETEVLVLVEEGRTNGQIARAFSISVKTAAVHVSNILGKLQAGNRGEAAAIARRTGLLTGSQS